MKIFCLVKSGLPLSDGMCDVLHATARSMIRHGRTKYPIRGDTYEGLVVATGKSASLGSVAGAVFEATIESNTFVTKVSYIVRTADLEGLEEGRWISDDPLDDFAPSDN